MRTTQRAAVLALLSLLAPVTTAIGIQPAAASPKVLCFAPQNAASSIQQRNDTLNDAVAGQRRVGSSQAEIDNVLAGEYGLERVSAPVKGDGSDAAILTDPSYITLAPPDIYRDTCTGRYSVFVRWDFNSTSALLNDLGFCIYVCSMGGYDGIGVAFSRNVSSATGYSISMWGHKRYLPASRAFPADANVYGVTFMGQDEMCNGGPLPSPCWSAGSEYSFMHGQLVYGINTPGCGQLQAFAKYGHTWSSTTINGFGVGPWSLSISWSSSANKWEKASQPSNVVTPC